MLVFGNGYAQRETNKNYSSAWDRVARLIHEMVTMVVAMVGIRCRQSCLPVEKVNLEGCADFLRVKIQNYPAQSLSFVTHSMGGIVLRKYIENMGKTKSIDRHVGVPNQGSYVAYKLRKIIPYVLGPGSLELGDKQKLVRYPFRIVNLQLLPGTVAIVRVKSPDSRR